MKPSVILYKTLPDDLQQRLEQHFTVTQVKNLRPETVTGENAQASCDLDHFRRLR